MTTDLQVSVEGVSDALLAAYAASGMERGKAGAEALRWAFGGNPAAFAVARHEGEIVGVSAYIRSRMTFGGTAGAGFQAVDSFTTPEMRGKGVFSTLARAYEAHAETTGADLIWGFPNDNAAPAWFGKLGWHRHGQVPFLVKPLRAGYFLRKARLPFDFPVSMARDQNLAPLTGIGDWADTLWERLAPTIGCGTIRDRAFLEHRLFAAPQAETYRTVADTDVSDPALVATREADKHGARIAYLMEALGGATLQDVLMSELGRLRGRGVELVLAWSFPWSPNYQTLRKAGFLPLPARLRPIRIWFGSRPKTPLATRANEEGQWYLSYLDSDTI
ncbi:MAG: GNAT family N-acetyltransferase [Rhodovulum sp.]